MVKYSRQRELIFQTVCNSRLHPTADDIYTALKKDNPNLSLGTVYRNLNQMADSGRLLKIQMPGQIDRFDATTCDHYHFVCRTCGRVLDVQKHTAVLPDIQQVEEHAVETMHVFFEGVCKNCREHV